MTDQHNITRTFSEWPASISVKFLHNDFDCVLTLRAETGGEVLTKLNQALTWLGEHGAVSHAENDKPAKPAPVHHQAAPMLGGGLPDSGWCTIHNCPMARREKDNQVWYSHKASDGTFCKGK